MDIVVDLALVVLLLGTAAGSLLVLWALLTGIRRQWQRIPTSAARRQALASGGATLAASVVVGALLVLAPWGEHTVLYLALTGAALMLAINLMVIVLGVRGRRPRRNTRRSS